uniref:Uncharacterized protein LOC104228935 n=1 Tax=Nicotiana sylvestris TaxID=4096 RepID=A0A1U7WR56_NICSY|nr:PREDICTED: uncharacterized protein LOC104228935 [Nicotiana sylvestris]
MNEDVAGDSTSSERLIRAKKLSANKQRDMGIKDRTLKLKEFKQENKILLTNLDSIDDPNIREFIRQEQKRIMDKRSQQFQQPQPQQSYASYT